MGNIVYITEWKGMFFRELPLNWKVYHYWPHCSSLINNPKRSNIRIVEKDDDELDSLGYRPCSNCLFAGIERGIYTEDVTESYIPDEEDMQICKELGILK